MGTSHVLFYGLTNQILSPLRGRLGDEIPQQGAGRAHADPPQALRLRYQSSGRRARARWPEPESPFCACCLLVNLNDGVVDKRVFKQDTRNNLSGNLVLCFTAPMEVPL